tara:strand:+ start:197 stop:364 length:168 start_codon:yes stop_codon:yes gene_type:complete
MKLCYALRKGFTPTVIFETQSKRGDHNPSNNNNNNKIMGLGFLITNKTLLKRNAP